MEQYAITFADGAMTTDSIASLLGVETDALVEACGALAAQRAPDDAQVLHYPELGVCYARLTDERARRLATSDRIAQLRKTRTLSTRLPDDVQKQALAGRAEPGELPWNLKLIRADEAWGLATGAGVKVGIVDTGIERDHPDLTIAGGQSFVPGVDDWNDIDGHGTLCAGIVAARPRGGIGGVAPDCSLYALKVVHQGEAENAWVLAAMLWAARERLDVLSISLCDEDGVQTPDEPPWVDLDRGAELLLASGCLVVGIAGNRGAYSRHWVTNPARSKHIIAVGSVDPERRWAPHSAYGPASLGPGQGVELVAPGQDIPTTRLGGKHQRTAAGTSFAGPHVSGAAALIKQRHPSWSPQQIRARLAATATGTPSRGFDLETGWGLIDCRSAVEDDQTSSPTYNQASGLVQRIARVGPIHVVSLVGPVELRRWDETVTLDDAALELPPAPTSGDPDAPPETLSLREADLPLLAASLGRRLTVFGVLTQVEPTRLIMTSLAILQVDSH